MSIEKKGFTKGRVPLLGHDYPCQFKDRAGTRYTSVKQYLVKFDQMVRPRTISAQDKQELINIANTYKFEQNPKLAKALSNLPVSDIMSCQDSVHLLHLIKKQLDSKVVIGGGGAPGVIGGGAPYGVIGGSAPYDRVPCEKPLLLCLGAGVELAYILSFLCNNQVESCIVLLNKQFYKFAKGDLVRGARSSYRLHSHILETHIDLSQVLIANICARFINIRKFHFGGYKCSSHPDEQDIKTFVKGIITNVQRQSLKLLGLNTRGNLRELKITGAVSASETLNERLLMDQLKEPGQFVNLTTLDIRYCVTADFFKREFVMDESLFKALPSLRNLRLNMVNGRQLSTIVSCCRLKQLTIKSLVNSSFKPKRSFQYKSRWRHPLELEYLSLSINSETIPVLEDYKFILTHLLAPCRNLRTFKLCSKKSHYFLKFNVRVLSPWLWTNVYPYSVVGSANESNIHSEDIDFPSFITGTHQTSLDGSEPEDDSDEDDHSDDDGEEEEKKQEPEQEHRLNQTFPHIPADTTTTTTTNTTTSTNTTSSLGAAPSLVRLILRNILIGPQMLLAMTQGCANTLEELSIDGCLNHTIPHRRMTSETWTSLLDKCTRLQKITIDGNGVTAGITQMSHVVDLSNQVKNNIIGLVDSLQKRNRDTREQSSLLLLKVSNLPLLYMGEEEHKHFSMDGALNVCKYIDVSRLHSLELVRCDTISDHEIPFMLENMQRVDAVQLRNLKIKDCGGALTNLGILKFAETCIHLRQVWINTRVDYETAKLFYDNNNPHLQVLYLAYHASDSIPEKDADKFKKEHSRDNPLEEALLLKFSPIEKFIQATVTNPLANFITRNKFEHKRYCDIKTLRAHKGVPPLTLP